MSREDIIAHTERKWPNLCKDDENKLCDCRESKYVDKLHRLLYCCLRMPSIPFRRLFSVQKGGEVPPTLFKTELLL